MSDNFANYPKSIGEIKSEQTKDASYWTPRECLIDLLRQIDNGANISTLIICYRQNVDGEDRGRYSQSTKDGLVTIGLLASTVNRMMK
jgi:hypothetical protein